MTVREIDRKFRRENDGMACSKGPTNAAVKTLVLIHGVQTLLGELQGHHQAVVFKPSTTFPVFYCPGFLDCVVGIKFPMSAYLQKSIKS